jgi:hypothetical protein
MKTYVIFGEDFDPAYPTVRGVEDAEIKQLSEAPKGRWSLEFDSPTSARVWKNVEINKLSKDED